MSAPFGMQPPPARSNKPLWLWLVVGLAGVSIIAMVAVMFVDFGFDNDTDPSDANKDVDDNSESLVNAGNRLFMQLVQGGKRTGNPYELVATIPPDANRGQVVSIAMLPGSKEFLLGSLPRNAGPDTEPTFVYWDVAKHRPLRRLSAAMQPGMRLHGISPGGETALFLNQERAAYVALKDGSFNTVRRFRENPAGPRGDIYLHPDGKSYLTFYADDLIVATIDGGQVTFRVDLPESDQHVRIFPLFFRDAAMYFTGTPGDYALRMINLKTGAIGDKHELSKRVTDLSSLHAMPRNDGVITATAAGAVIISIPRGNTGKLELGPGESPAFYLPRTDVMVVNGPGTIRLWDMATKVDLANFKPHPETATRNGVPTASARAIATEDGQTLITVGENGALKFWRLRQ